MTNEIKMYEQLQLKDDFLFAKIMSDKEICKRLLEIILDVKISDIVYLEPQKTIDLTANAKSVRLDVYVADESHKIYYVEMQTFNRKNLPRRSRYYQGMSDLDSLEKGMDYNALNDSYIIFICMFDLFGKGRSIYTFQNCCKEDNSIILADGTTKIFLNATGTGDDVSEDLAAFLKYLAGEVRDNKFIKEIDEAVVKARNNIDWRHDYMTLEMKYREFLEDGRELGLELGREEGIRVLIQTLREEDIEEERILTKLVTHFGMSEEQARKYYQKYTNIS